VSESRNGSTAEPATPVQRRIQRRILDLIDTPRAISALELLRAEESFDARAELAVLDQVQLVWLEGGQARGLVTQHKRRLPRVEEAPNKPTARLTSGDAE
jgi:hypothetical protein